ncbi:UDP-glucose 4-epimerase GalE [Mangrovactinospora gilvigrisea]|uniref:UDP-glucose 4-epimerase n=1 Tax=Mangrovactinospora gilvigrisea TaxID=1428644 RepID=A0A1J7BF36_9ACTN|nr:UDP-glucose 4-epimerase GalE [Mangrovactinospora gilvigrisea]OIV37299.1 UDP-glucose 4-epimerase GalE [Mangrovactinospora gilvigrisea]
MKVLITGGAGFIGSTVATRLLQEGDVPVLLDDLSRGRAEFGDPLGDGRVLYRGDIADEALVERILTEHPDIEAVVHCAARIVVPESVADPLTYYRTNVAKPLTLVRTLLRHGVRRFLFSSTAALYEPGEDFTVTEESAPNPTNPYARSKLMLEQALADITAAEPLRVLSLRYFNPVGADPELRTGLQDPYPSHALGRLIQAHEKHEPYVLMGTDWPTRDGSTVRDYIHVWDLAEAHAAALHRFDAIVAEEGPHPVINLGTGRGTTVRELVAAFDEVTGGTLEVVEAPRREGDVIGCYTRVDKAERLLGWRAAKTLREGIADSLAWAAKRPSVLGE